jgi:hypothetical protein
MERTQIDGGENMKKFVIAAGILLLVVAFAGCTGGGGGETAKAPATEAPATPPATEAPKETEAAPGYEATALHGEGKCDQCHDAPKLEDMRTGLHKQAFEKFEGHKNFCQECHDVQKTCTQCHALPAIMQ